jgi:cation diffusion facilitator family transporter
MQATAQDLVRRRPRQTDPRLQAIRLSVAAAIINIALKGSAYLFTGSISLLSGAADSFINLAAALMATCALFVAIRGVGRRGGSAKTEYISSGLESILIIGLALLIVWEALGALVNPAPLESLGWGLAISLVATGVNFVVGLHLLRTSRRTGSIVLETDGRHLLLDVWTAMGMLLGLSFAWLTGWYWLDAVFAVAIALYFLATGVRLLGRSLRGLLAPTGAADIAGSALAV